MEKSFGREAKQALLFDVWDSFADTDLMKKLQKDYGLDEDSDGISDDTKLELAEEYLARLNETYGKDLKEVFADNINEISEWAQRHGYDFNDLVTRDQMTADWIQDSGYTPDMPNALQRFLARVRFWLRQHGFYNANISDRDLVYMLSEITRAGYEKRWNEKEWAQRESNGDVQNGTDENRENGTSFSVNDKPYYLMPFADSVDAVINAENQKNGLAIDKENAGEAAIFGANKKIVSKLSLRDLQLVQRNSFNTIHNITDKNSPVKLDIKKILNLYNLEGGLRKVKLSMKTLNLKH